IVRMDIVADTNIFLAVALNEPDRDRIITLTADASALAPEILPYEIGNALSAMVKRRQLSYSEALEAEKSVRRIPVRLVSTDIRSSMQLALDQDIYAYDAYFLQCAQALSCPLLTLDRRMRQVARELGIRVLE
ncbi:type II toxin-antitoxin system VapC family toxin, partial [Halorhodospira halochloris]|uniref:type II toxin-antitoxin system VapC family toxin n=1 Tax=Halorhodospira halochloris TaxID=1052 RepID=UPI001EE913E0